MCQSHNILDSISCTNENLCHSGIGRQNVQISLRIVEIMSGTENIVEEGTKWNILFIIRATLATTLITA